MIDGYPLVEVLLAFGVAVVVSWIVGAIGYWKFRSKPGAAGTFLVWVLANTLLGGIAALFYVYFPRFRPHPRLFHLTQYLVGIATAALWVSGTLAVGALWGAVLVRRNRKKSASSRGQGTAELR